MGIYPLFTFHLSNRDQYKYEVRELYSANMCKYSAYHDAVSQCGSASVICRGHRQSYSGNCYATASETTDSLGEISEA